ncbi:MAG TPA: glycosyltransferase [Deltaproteobacteria bacterium]|nr:glycosyltransferase [Deltaproteobacteria bacterium]
MNAVEDKFPLVSVIVRTKDRPHLLREALESIAAQSYSHIEIIVVNDGGEDVGSIVHSRAHAFQTCRYISLSGQQGRAAAANNGLHAASGDLIGFLDDDDLLEPTGIEHLVKAAKDINERAPVYGIVYAVDEDGSIVFTYANPFCLAQIFLSNYIPIHAVLIPKALVDEVGLMDPDFTIFEDWDWFYRMARCRAFVYTPHVIGYYRILGQATVTGRHGEDLHQKARKQFYRKHWNDLNPDTLMAIESIRLAMQHEVQELRNALKKRENKIGALNWEVKDQQRVITELKEQNHNKNQRLGELEWEVEGLKQALALWQAQHGSFKRSLGTWLRKIIRSN